MESDELGCKSSFHPNGFNFLPLGESLINSLVFEAEIIVHRFSTGGGSRGSGAPNPCVVQGSTGVRNPGSP